MSISCPVAQRAVHVPGQQKRNHWAKKLHPHPALTQQSWLCCRPVQAFLTTTSVRSFSKAYNSPTRAQRLLWTTFVFIMFVLLALSSMKIITEFMEYNTTLQTRIVINDGSHFPAITLCNNQPFSANAEAQWLQGTLSPNGFSKILRNISLNAFLQKDVHLAERVLVYERQRIYYQNLDYHETLRLSHNISDLLVLCLNFNANGLFVGNSEDCGLDVSLWSSPDHFNCYTLTPKLRYSLSTAKLNFIVRFPKLNVTQHNLMDRAFLQDIFKTPVGGLVSIHERDQIPRSATIKVYLEPGKLVRILYHNERLQEYSTPTDPCTSDERPDPSTPSGTTRLPLVDLSNSYSYSYDECVRQHSALEVLNQCHCFMADFPRAALPNESHPYCGNIVSGVTMDMFRRRTICIRNVTSIEKQERFRRSVCLRRCVIQHFQTEISNTAWMPMQWKLDWLMELTQAWGKLSESHRYSEKEMERVNRSIVQYLTSGSLQELMSHSDQWKGEGGQLSDHMAEYGCLEVERNGNDTTVKNERLSLTTLGLISRIGGSCSLYLGLTCIFFIELLETCLFTTLKEAMAGCECGSMGSLKGRRQGHVNHLTPETTNPQLELPVKNDPQHEPESKFLMMRSSNESSRNAKQSDDVSADITELYSTVV